MAALYIPGMRVEVRDAEWRIQRVDRCADGGFLLHCHGLSELVRGRDAQFLTRLEESLNQAPRVLDPATTQLVDDTSSGYRAAQLFIATALRQTPPAGDKICLGHEAALDVLPFQLDPALQALKQPRQRILIADAVGLGKTLEAGILVSELIRRGRGKRILVLATKSMLGQFQMEFWQRFTVPLVRLDSVGLQRVRNQIPANHNPFHYFDRAIISIDTLKQTLEYRHYLEQAYWDIIIIDEAHNVARRSNNSQRHQLAELLSTRSDTLIMLSATPHDGKAESFASLVNMLDPTAIADPSDYAHEDFRDKGLVVRRLKQDVASQLSESFPQREIQLEKINASVAEESAYQTLSEISFKAIDSSRNTGSILFRTTLEKALFSSPQACISTVSNRLRRLQQRLQQEPDADLQHDISELEGLLLSLKGIAPQYFTKYQLLLELLSKKSDKSLGWSRESDDRLVIFTESLETLKFLEEQLTQDLKLKSGQLAILRGTMRDSELASVVEQFGQRDSKIRLLLCSDVASEGINLHHLSHRMVHFDIPWSLMVFQQRNGRIDRYGQTQQPQIRYLLTESSNQKIRGDQRILEVLVRKDEQAGRNIGDPAEFMGVFNIEDEEALVAAAIESDKNLENTDDLSDFFDDLFGDSAGDAKDTLNQFVDERVTSTNFSNMNTVVQAMPRLFEHDLAYTANALQWLKELNADLTFNVKAKENWLELEIPADLKQRLKFLPREIQPENNRFLLTTDKARVQQSIKARRDSDESPYGDVQYLWPLHPVMEWVQSRVQDAFGRHTAPVLRLPGKLGQDEHWYIVQGGFPNKRGQALIQDTIAVQVRSNRVGFVQPVLALLKQLEIDGSQIPNSAQEGSVALLERQLRDVISAVTRHLQAERDKQEAPRLEQLNQYLSKLKDLRAKHVGQLELQLERSDQPEAFKQRLRSERMHHIERVFDEYTQWLNDTQKTERDPYIQLVAVITGHHA